MPTTVLVTGISGFIAKHLAFQLLEKGYHVRGTVRSSKNKEPVLKALQDAGADTSHLELVEADLDQDAGWVEAMSGVEFLHHVASPFPINQPKDREALVPQAKQGTLRVLNAAKDANVKKIVVTSSTVAMTYFPDRSNQFRFSENSWTDPEWDKLSPYVVSKTRAEKALWGWADTHQYRERIVTVNPGFVLGPGLDAKTGTSLQVIEYFLTGKYPAVPDVRFPSVDVRDVATLHVAAMESEVANTRLLAAKDTISMAEIGSVLKEAFPAYCNKIPNKTLPNFLVRILSIFDSSLKLLIPDLGVVPTADSKYVEDRFNFQFRSASSAAIDAAQSLIDFKVVSAK